MGFGGALVHFFSLLCWQFAIPASSSAAAKMATSSEMKDRALQRGAGARRAVVTTLQRREEDCLGTGEEEITVEEVRAAVTRIPGRKALALDGFTVFFYKAYMDILKEPLTKTFSEVLACGTDTEMMLELQITLLNQPKILPNVIHTDS
ncbi:hypothetical protein NDU88_008520 [Pleurodeles waltl]|uniref:Uncharacterized protein n=1 Tax=Pleurodeles waltl TaxID=8319 RepID=A0AAV7PSF0_PLEWA|nr:hypothetical protein NDU88_008520 [Pleurodeles waltl]